MHIYTTHYYFLYNNIVTIVPYGAPAIVKLYIVSLPANPPGILCVVRTRTRTGTCKLNFEFLMIFIHGARTLIMKGCVPGLWCVIENAGSSMFSLMRRWTKSTYLYLSRD